MLFFVNGYKFTFGHFYQILFLKCILEFSCVCQRMLKLNILIKIYDICVLYFSYLFGKNKYTCIDLLCSLLIEFYKIFKYFQD